MLIFSSNLPKAIYYENLSYIFHFCSAWLKDLSLHGHNSSTSQFKTWANFLPWSSEISGVHGIKKGKEICLQILLHFEVESLTGLSAHGFLKIT